MKAIELIGLKKTYSGGVRALAGLDLSVDEGTLLGFVGPNGAGKSTAINIMAGLIRKDEGEVRLLGKDIGPADFEFKRDVGFVLETPSYIEKLTAREYLNFAAAMYDIGARTAKSRIDELLDFFDLEKKKKAAIETFSAGMKKKMSLAAAIIHRPKILILDEPLEAIDRISARAIKENLRLMVRNGATVLLSSHVLDTVEKLCDEIAIVNGGKIVYRNTMSDIRIRLKNELELEAYSSLEEIFIQVVGGDGEDDAGKKLSWL